MNYYCNYMNNYKDLLILNIEKTRKRLDKLIACNKSLVDSDIIRLSQRLDFLITYYSKFQTKLSTPSVKDVSGQLNDFYYCSRKHLYICLLSYINIGIKNNDFILFSGDKEFFDYLKLQLSLTHKNDMPISHLNSYDLPPIPLSYSEINLEVFFNNLELSSYNDTYNSIRLINQTDCISCNTRILDNPVAKSAIKSMLKSKNISLLNLYDIQDTCKNNNDNSSITISCDLYKKMAEINFYTDLKTLF